MRLAYFTVEHLKHFLRFHFLSTFENHITGKYAIVAIYIFLNVLTINLRLNGNNSTILFDN